jgi:hypothetical protein
VLVTGGHGAAGLTQQALFWRLRRGHCRSGPPTCYLRQEIKAATLLDFIQASGTIHTIHSLLEKAELQSTCIHAS